MCVVDLRRRYLVIAKGRLLLLLLLLSLSLSLSSLVLLCVGAGSRMERRGVCVCDGFLLGGEEDRGSRASLKVCFLHERESLLVGWTSPF